MVIRKRSIFVGGTSYAGATRDDIISDIMRFKKIAEDTIKKLNDLKVKNSDDFSEHIAEETNNFIDRQIDNYSCYIDDFNRLIQELPKSVTEGHCEILRQISLGIQKEEHRCKDLKNNLEKASKKQEFEIINRVYTEAKELIGEFYDIDNLRDRLLTFVGIDVKSSRKISKRKGILNDGMSEIDKSKWRPPSGTFIFPKAIKVDFLEEYSTKPTKRRKTRNYKFHIIWDDSELKELDVKDYSQMDSLFNIFLASKTDEPVITKREIQRYLETKQPPNRAIRDINDALVDKLRRKFPKQRDHIPDLIIGYSKKKDGYISLIPIQEESALDALDKEEHLLGEPTKEFLKEVQVKKRGGKKM